MVIYPIVRRPISIAERIALNRHGTVGFCNVCGRWSRMTPWTDNYRESGKCVRCQSINRHRQVSWVLCNAMREVLGKPVRSLHDIPRDTSVAIYNTETSGPVHQHLCSLPRYICSEYFGPGHAAGELVNGVRHEDLQYLSFDDGSLDIMVSSDVFEHVPEPYQAFREVHRVLKSQGGRHIFTVPFHQTDFKDEVRAVIENGETKLLKKPIYHLDPLRPEGILVYTIFALEMLSKLNDIGFHPRMHLLYQPTLGILGNNALVFEAIKL